MPIPVYLQESDDIAKRRFELQKEQAQRRHERLLATHPDYAREYYKAKEEKRIADINNSIIENAEKKDKRRLFERWFNQKPLEAELDNKYAINSDYLEIGPDRLIDRTSLLARGDDEDYYDSNNKIWYNQGILSAKEPITLWRDRTMGAPGTERGRKLEELKKAGQADWDKGYLRNIRYNYATLQANHLYEEAESYLDHIVNDKYKLISTKYLSQQEKDELERKQFEKTGVDYSIHNVSPEATRQTMESVSPYYREFKNKKNYKGDKYIDFTDLELKEIGQQYKDNLRYYGEAEADRYLQNIVQQRVADNTPLSQRLAVSTYSIVTDAVGMLATVAGIIGKLTDVNVKNNSSYNKDRNWWQNYLQGIIDNKVTRWAQGLTQYQSWDPDNINDDMRLMGGRFAGTMRGVGEDIFNTPGRYLLPEMIRLAGMIIGTKGSSALLSTGSKFATKGLGKTYSAAVKSLGKETIAARRSMVKFNRAMEDVNSCLNVANAGIVAMGEGVINSLQTYDDALAGNYMALAEHLGLDPNKNRTKEQILTSLAINDMANMGLQDSSPQSQQTIFAELYAKHEKELEGYMKVIEDEALDASQLDFLANAAINGPIYMTMTDYVFSKPVRQQIRGSRINLLNNKRFAARRQARLDARNARRVANGKKPIVRLDGQQSLPWAFVKGPIGEGLEEYLQNLSTEGAQAASSHYIEEFLKNYSNEDALELFSDSLTEVAEPNIKKWSSYWEGVGEAALSRESMESLVLGAIGGTLVPTFDVTARNKDNIKDKDGKLKRVWWKKGLNEEGKPETGWERFRRAVPIEFTPVTNVKSAKKYNQHLEEYDKEISERLKAALGVNDLSKVDDLKSLIALFNIQDKKQDAVLSRDDFALKNAKLEELVELSLLMNRRPNNASIRTFIKSLETILNTKEDSEEANNLVKLAAEKFEGDDMFTDENKNLIKPAVFKQIQKNAKDMIDMLERVKKEDKRLNRIYGDDLSVDARKALIFGTIFQEDLGRRHEQVQKEVNDVLRDVFGSNANSPTISLDDIMRYRNADNVKKQIANLKNKRTKLEKDLASAKDEEKEKINKQISNIDNNISKLDNLLTDVFDTSIPLGEQNPQSSLNYITAEQIASLTPKQRTKLINKKIELQRAEEQNKLHEPQFEKAQIDEINRFFESGNAKDPEFASKARDLGRIEEAYERTVDDNIKLQSDPNFLYTQTHKNYSKARAKILQKRVDKLAKITSQKEFDKAMDNIKSEMTENEWLELQAYIMNSELGGKEIFRNWAKNNGYAKKLLKKDIEQYLQKALDAKIKNAKDRQAVFADFLSVINIVNGIIETVEDIKDVKKVLQNYIETEKKITDKDKRTLTDGIEEILKPLIQQLDKIVDIKANATEQGKPTPKETKKEKEKQAKKGKEKKEGSSSKAKSNTLKGLEEGMEEPNPHDQKEDIEQIIEDQKTRNSTKKQDNRVTPLETESQKENEDFSAAIIDILKELTEDESISDEDIFTELDNNDLLSVFKNYTKNQLEGLLKTKNINERAKEFLQQRLDDVTNIAAETDIDETNLEDTAVEDLDEGKISNVNTSEKDKDYDLTSQKRYLYNVAEDHTAEEIPDTSRSQDGVQFLTTKDGNAVGILNQHGALEFVNNGSFADVIRANPDTKIYFLCWKKDKGLTENNSLPHPFLAIEHQNGDIVMGDKRFQIVGALGYAEGSGKKETNVRQKLINTLKDNHEKGRLESEGEDGFVTTEFYTTKVKQLFAGKYIVNSENENGETEAYDVNVQWMQGRPLAIQLYYSDQPGGHPIFNIPNDVDDKDVQEISEDEKYNGSVWIYFKAADGRWYPAQVHLKMFNSDEYNFDKYKDTPLMRELLQQAGILFDSNKSEKQKLAAKRTIYNLLYFMERDDNDRPYYDIVFDNDSVSIRNAEDEDNEKITDAESLIRYLLDSDITIRISLHDYHFAKKSNGKSQTPFQKITIEEFVLQSGILSTTHTVAGNVNGGFSVFEEAPEDRPDSNVSRPTPHKTEQKQESETVTVTFEKTTTAYYRKQEGDSFVITTANGHEKVSGKKAALLNAIFDNADTQNSVITFEHGRYKYTAELSYSKDGTVLVTWSGTTNAYEKELKKQQKEDDTKELIETSTPVKKGEYVASNISTAFQDAETDKEITKEMSAVLEFGTLGQPTKFKFKNCKRIHLQGFPDAIVYIGTPINKDGVPFNDSFSIIICDSDGEIVGFDTFPKEAFKNKKEPLLLSTGYHKAGETIHDWLNNQGTNNKNKKTKTEQPKEPKPKKENKTEEKRTKETTTKKTKTTNNKEEIKPSKQALNPNYAGPESEENWENPKNDGLYHDDPTAVQQWMDLYNFKIDMFDVTTPAPLRYTAGTLENIIRKLAREYYLTTTKEKDGFETWSHEFESQREAGESIEAAQNRLTLDKERSWLNDMGIQTTDNLTQDVRTLCMTKILNMSMEDGTKWVERIRHASPQDALQILKDLSECH